MKLNYCQSGKLNQASFQIELLQKNIFNFTIRVTNQETSVIRTHPLGRLTKNQKQRLVIEFRKLVMVFSSLKLGSLEIETEQLVDFIDDGAYETISRWDMDKFNCEMKGKDFRKVDE